MHVHALAPVVAVDLDGTLADYHEHFLWFLNHIYDPNRRPPYYMNWDPDYRGEFSESLGMDKAEYRDAKLAYRQGGLKRCVPMLDSNDWAAKLEIAEIRKLGVQVWITTNRPWLRLDNIDRDTLYWIHHNLGEVDGVIFSQNKYQDLIDHVGKDRILGVLDDLPENIEAAQRLGIKHVLREGDHNSWYGPQTFPVHRISSIFDLMDEYIIPWKDEWDANNPRVR